MRIKVQKPKDIQKLRIKQQSHPKMHMGKGTIRNCDQIIKMNRLRYKPIKQNKEHLNEGDDRNPPMIGRWINPTTDIIDRKMYQS